MTPAERRRLARTAIPTGWLVGFGLALFFGASVLATTAPLVLLWDGALTLANPAAIVELFLQLELFAASLCVAGALSLGVYERAVVRGSLSRRAETDPVVAIASCYGDTRRWLRPSGAILVTETHVEVVAHQARNADHDLRWPLAELEGVVTERDRLWIVHLAELLGPLVLSRGTERRSVSVVRRRPFHEALCAAWDRARAERHRAGASGDPAPVRG